MSDLGGLTPTQLGLLALAAAVAVFLVVALIAPRRRGGKGGVGVAMVVFIAFILGAGAVVYWLLTNLGQFTGFDD